MASKKTGSGKSKGPGKGGKMPCITHKVMLTREALRAYA